MISHSRIDSGPDDNGQRQGFRDCPDDRVSKATQVRCKYSGFRFDI